MILVDGNGNKEHGETDAEDKDAEEIHLDHSLLDASKGNLSKLARLDQTHLFSTVLVVNKDENQGGDNHGRDDGPHAHAPSPTRTSVHDESVGDGTAGPGRHNVGGGGVGEHQTSVLQAGRVGNEDGDAVADALRTIGGHGAGQFLKIQVKLDFVPCLNLPNGGKHIGGRVLRNILARSHHDEANRPDEEHESHALRPTPNVKNLGQGQLGDAAKNA